MKLTLLLLILLSLGFSQKKSQFGIIGSANLNSASVKGSTPDNKTSFNAGLAYKSGSLVFSGVYDQKHVKDEILGTKLTAKYSYLTFGAQYRAELGKLYFSAGPALGVKLEAKKIEESGGNETKTDIDDVEKTRLSAVIGAGYYVNDNFSISASYDLGLSDAIKDTKSKLSSFQVGIGYWF